MKKNLRLFLFFALTTVYSCQRRDKVLVIIRGDSFADGIGSDGTTSSADFYSGKQIQGDSTWGKQLQSLLEKQNDFAYEVDMIGFPGQTAKWFLNSDQMPKLQQTVKSASDKYKYIVYCSEFGTNEEANPGVNDSTSVDSLAVTVAEINKRVKAAASEPKNLFVLGYPLTRRIDKYAQPKSNTFRINYNNKIMHNASLIGADYVMDYKKYPTIYSNSAPEEGYFKNNDVDKLSGVHLNDRGQHELAEMTADGVTHLMKKRHE